MRIIILLLLGLAAVGGVVYGIHLVWRAFSSSSRGGAVPFSLLPAPWDRRLSWLLFWVTLLLLLLMVVDRLQLDGESPADLTAPPPMKGRAAPIPDRYR
ncbi:MAG: hypothetical protein H7837_01010 [Magnetococcus sp. MYC-9]